MTKQADLELLERIESIKSVGELEDTGEPYKHSEKAKKPEKSIYCRHGLIYHPECGGQRDRA